MSRVSFRDARMDDVAAIVGLLADDDLGRSREAPGDLAPYRKAFEELNANPSNRLLVAEGEGKVVGCLQLTIIPGLSRQGARRGLIEAVRVDTSRRGEGIGEAMIRHAIGMALKADCRLVQLTSDKKRLRVHEFYRRLGFVASHEGFKLELAP